jgi:hypothetical protein
MRFGRDGKTVYQDTHGSNDGREQKRFETVFWLSGPAILRRHIIGNHINEPTTNENSQKGTDKPGQGKQTDVMDLPLIWRLNKNHRRLKLDDHIPDELVRWQKRRSGFGDWISLTSRQMFQSRCHPK